MHYSTRLLLCFNQSLSTTYIIIININIIIIIIYQVCQRQEAQKAKKPIGVHPKVQTNYNYKTQIKQLHNKTISYNRTTQTQNSYKNKYNSTQTNKLKKYLQNKLSIYTQKLIYNRTKNTTTNYRYNRIRQSIPDKNRIYKKGIMICINK